MSKVTNLPKTNSSEPSVVFITMHKAGSVLVNDILDVCLTEKGMPHMDIARRAFENGIREFEACVPASVLFVKPGYYFGAFRGPYIRDFEDMSHNKIVVQVRDPRDCIVSMYFSSKFSHGAPGQGDSREVFDKFRSHAIATDINDFAIDQTRAYNLRMRTITEVREKYDEHILLKYEDMIAHFDDWLARLFAYLGVSPSAKAMQAIYNMANFDIEVEDINNHRRQVTPGDHRRKLKPETIEEMNEIMAEPLKLYGYL